uniref:Uncharacterized protein n=2 Tax=Trypanosoma brucei TaxID=5691 RepID=B3GVD6_TRYBB|nr:hypothetical protein [Trypanosoma brucei]CAQ57289.1 hypothetical protein Tb427.BES40.17 [Trypanosoma brucei brucei]
MSRHGNIDIGCGAGNTMDATFRSCTPHESFYYLSINHDLKAREAQNNNTNSDTICFSTHLHKRSNRRLDRRCEYIFGICSIKGNSAARRKKFLKTPLCQRYVNNCLKYMHSICHYQTRPGRTSS